MFDRVLNTPLLPKYNLQNRSFEKFFVIAAKRLIKKWKDSLKNAKTKELNGFKLKGNLLEMPAFERKTL